MNSASTGSIAVPIVFIGLWLIERHAPAQPFVRVERWNRIGASFFLLTATLGVAASTVWRSTGIAEFSILHLDRLELVAVVPGLVVVTFLDYWWHRAVHRFRWLWLLTHQLHHSARRVDIAGAFYTHPLEVVAKSFLGFLVSTSLLGLGAAAASAVATLTALLTIFQHWNVRTPRWIGLFVPRPEMHCLHHEFGVHARNYSTLPVWDIIFGTFENPDLARVPVGFDEAASSRIADMLLFKDVNRLPGEGASSEIGAICLNQKQAEFKTCSNPPPPKVSP